MTTNKFWEQKTPAEFTEAEWEAVCTRCGKCCQLKLEDEDTGDIFYTDVVCQYFNHDNCSCNCYHERCTKVPSCLKLNAYNIGNLEWIPSTCAYRILHQTGSLPAWHPLVTGKPLPDQYSARGKVVSELNIDQADLEDHIIEDWEND